LPNEFVQVLLEAFRRARLLRVHREVRVVDRVEVCDAQRRGTSLSLGNRGDVNRRDDHAPKSEDRGNLKYVKALPVRSDAKRAEEDLSHTRAERLTELARVRTRIATDLHDDIGASLTQIAILSEVARQQNMQGNGASLDPLNSIVNVSNELVETMSDIVWAINPEKDRLQDLIQRMRRFASDLLSAKGVHFDFNAPTYVLEIPLGANARREVFLIFKESLTNIAKHAGATLVKIDFDISQDDLRLSISDNGHGFDLERSGPALAAWEKGGHGIFSMKKRAAELNGTLDIK